MFLVRNNMASQGQWFVYFNGGRGLEGVVLEWSQVTLVCSQRLENHCQRVTGRGWSSFLSVPVFSGAWDSRFIERK